MRKWSETFEMSTVPDDVLASEYARRANAKRQTFGAGSGRPRSRKKRCPCGKNTLTRAKARGFDCCKLAGVDYS